MRLDKWLWHARFVKTRGLAQNIITGGKLRLNGQKCDKASAKLRIGDELSFVAHDRLYIVRVEALSTRRVSAPEAQTRYSHIQEPENLKPPRAQQDGQRERGQGRPSKKDRRQLDAWRDQDKIMS